MLSISIGHTDTHTETAAVCFSLVVENYISQKCNWVGLPVPLLIPAPCRRASWEAARDGSSPGSPTTHAGDVHWSPGSWVSPVPDTAVVCFWRVNQWMECPVLLSFFLHPERTLYLLPPPKNKQTNKSSSDPKPTCPPPRWAVSCRQVWMQYPRVFWPGAASRQCSGGTHLAFCLWAPVKQEGHRIKRQVTDTGRH